MAPAGLELDPPGLLRLAAARRVTLLATVPTLLRLWAGQPELERCTRVRHIVCGGEALDWDLVRRVFGRLPVPVTNLYGPTEATIDVAYRTCVPGEPAVSGATVPIGRPLPGATLAVHRPGGGLAPPGVPGELFISGLPLSLGYLGRPGETAARFQPDPSAGPGARRYATGDRVTWLATGELLFGGRVDGQVKLHGYRMELGEIAAVARGCPGVTDAAAAVAPGSGGPQQLVLYVAAAADSGDDAGLAQRVLGAARARLPRPMVPARVTVVPRLPLLPNGKLDLRALNIAHPTGDGRAPADPAGSAAERLLGIFRRVLAAGDMGYDDSFFDRGGDSIRAIQAVAQATAAGIQVTVADLLKLQTARNLAGSARAAAANYG
jgi:acyl-coenzyme A synthetase/AMP-(fatty) acid ligase/aryl carrier-like protein